MTASEDNGGSGNGSNGSRTRRRVPLKFSPRKQKAYLDLIGRGDRRMASARAVGVDPRTVRRHAAKSRAFREKRDDAEMAALERIEDTMYRRAQDGHVGAGIFVLCNRDPQKWRDVKAIEVSGPGGGAIPYEQVLSEIEDDRARVLRELTSGRSLGDGASSQ